MSNIDYNSRIVIWGQPAEIGSFVGHSLHRFGFSISRHKTTPGLEKGFAHYELLEYLEEIGIDADQAQADDTMIRMEMSDYVDDDMILAVSRTYPDLTFWLSWSAWGSRCGEDNDEYWPLIDEGCLTARAGWRV